VGTWERLCGSVAHVAVLSGMFAGTEEEGSV
jgi:hypothetical protein